MSLVSFIGPKPNLLDINQVNPPMRLEVSQPILDFADMAKLRGIEKITQGKFRSYTLDITYPLHWGHEGVDRKSTRLNSSHAKISPLPHPLPLRIYLAVLLQRPKPEPADHQPGQPADAAGSQPADPGLRRHGQAARHREDHAGQVPQLHAGHHLPAALGP